MCKTKPLTAAVSALALMTLPACMRCARRPDFVIDATFDLFCDLCATDEQCDFPVVYASGVNGIAGGSPAELADDLAPLFEAIVREVRHSHTCAAGVDQRACSTVRTVRCSTVHALDMGLA